MILHAVLPQFPASCKPDPNHVVYHGSSVRNYSTIRGEDIINLPGSALVVYVVDESGSMIGEHQWLNTTVISLDENLKARKVMDNLYALVGFASQKPTRDSQLGRIIPVGPNGEHCGTATQVKDALKNLHTDGRIEDGYSAMGVALQDVSCMKARMRQRANATACQIILITDEDRDILTAWTFETMREELARQDCILNVIIKERFMGKEGRREYQALGVDRRGRAVVASSDNSNFEFKPNGAPIPQTG